MNRFHDIWDSKQKRQIKVQFSPEEETARDAEEAQVRAEQPLILLEQEMQANSAGIAEDMATFMEQYYKQYPERLATRPAKIKDLHAKRKDLCTKKDKLQRRRPE